MKFKDFGVLFFERRRLLVHQGELCSSSLRADEIRYRQALKKLGEFSLKSLTVEEIEKFLDYLSFCELSNATRNRYRALLHSFLKLACKQGYIDKNPVTEIGILSEKIKKRVVSYWKTTKERDRYIQKAFNFHPMMGTCAAILSLGGIRISEALALTWEDIEWDKDLVRIRKIIEAPTGKLCYRTKGQRAFGEYQMILVPRLKEILQKAPRKMRCDWVLYTPDGTPLNYRKVYKTHFKIVEQAGLPRITLHDLRRTFATHAERAGFHRSEIGELLGHETLTATEAYVKMDISHLVDKAKKVGFGS